MLAPQQHDTYTLFMVRWLCWKQDLSHINHKRFELGQDSCKGTEIRQCILYSDTLQKGNVPHARKMDPSLLLQSLFLFKISEAFLFPLWWCPDCWVWVMSAAADRLSLTGTISLIAHWTWRLGCCSERLLTGYSHMLSFNKHHAGFSKN